MALARPSVPDVAAAEKVERVANDPELRVVLGIAVAAVTYLVIVGVIFNRR